MMSRAQKFGFAIALLASPLASYAAPPKATNAAPREHIQSAFIMPKTPEDGRDPFFPNATSLYQTAAVKPVADSGINLLKLNGILGSSLAQVNNVTLSVGETEEVKTTSGTVSVRLVAIHAADGSAVIEANGERRVLSFKSK
jgi:hypothetical protein